MARRNLGNRNTRNLQRKETSYYVTLPIEEIRTLGWRERQKVVIKRSGKRLIIEDWKK